MSENKLQSEATTRTWKRLPRDNWLLDKTFVAISKNQGEEMYTSDVTINWKDDAVPLVACETSDPRALTYEELYYYLSQFIDEKILFVLHPKYVSLHNKYYCFRKSEENELYSGTRWHKQYNTMLYPLRESERVHAYYEEHI